MPMLRLVARASRCGSPPAQAARRIGCFDYLNRVDARTSRVYDCLQPPPLCTHALRMKRAGPGTSVRRAFFAFGALIAAGAALAAASALYAYSSGTSGTGADSPLLTLTTPNPQAYADFGS